MAQAQANLQGLTFKNALDACVQAVSSGDLEAAGTSSPGGGLISQ